MDAVSCTVISDAHVVIRVEFLSESVPSIAAANLSLYLLKMCVVLCADAQLNFLLSLRKVFVVLLTWA